MALKEEQTLELSKEKLVDLYRQMLTIRAFEEKLLEANERHLITGTAHTYIGEEAVAVGVCAALDEGDYLTSTHRGHGHAIARGMDVNRMLAEILGRATGYCKGKGGSMHITDMSLGMLGADGIVGGGIPMAVGAALACRNRGRSQVAVSFFGDGASNQGSFHEGLNFAAVQNLPVILVCENNHWALSASVAKTTSVSDIATRAAGYSVPGMVVDGNNVQEVYDVAAQAVQRARSGEGPSLIECKTYRWHPHSVYTTTDPRPGDEVDMWKRKDPIARFSKVLNEDKIISSEEDQEIRNQVDQLMAEAEKFALDSPYPEPEDAINDVYA